MARWKNINGVLQKIAGSVRIDQVLNKLSRNAISNKAVSEKFEEVDLSLEIAANDMDALSDNVSGLSDTVSALSNNLSGLSVIVANSNKPKQINDSLAFDTKSYFLYDWIGYVKGKAPQMSDYVTLIKLASPDVHFYTLIVISTDYNMHICRINAESRTITFVRTLT